MTMLSLPRISGSTQLEHLVHAYGGAEKTAKDLRIHKGLLSRYLNGSQEPPYTLLLAIYFAGPYGFSQAFSESHWTHQYNYRKRVIAEHENETLVRLLQSHGLALPNEKREPNLPVS